MQSHHWAPITPICPWTWAKYASVYNYLVSLVFFMKKLGSEHASSGDTVAWNLVWGHFTSAKPKQTAYPKSITVASSDALGTGELFEATSPLLRTATGVFLSNELFILLEGNRFVLMLLATCFDLKVFWYTIWAKRSRFLCRWAMSWKLEAVNSAVFFPHIRFCLFPGASFNVHLVFVDS